MIGTLAFIFMAVLGFIFGFVLGFLLLSIIESGKDKT